MSRFSVSRLLRGSVARCVGLLFVLAFALPAFASTTPAEQRASQAAQHELDTSPRDGNLPSYALPPDALAKGVHLEHVRTVLHFGGALWGIVQLVLLLWLGGIAWMQRTANHLRNRWLQGFSFMGLFLLAGTLLDLPLDIYGQALRRHYGLSVQGWGSWAGDQLKGFGLGWVFGGLLVMLLFWVLRRFPRRWWLVFFAALVPIVLFTMFAEPYVIEPLFNHFEPLAKSNPALVGQLERVAERGHMNIPPDRMFLMKASEKVTTLNAYVSGFGASKRVVVWDTSLAKGTPDEILFIFGHESGHYVLGHIVRGLVTALAGLFVLLWLAAAVLGWLLRRFGPAWGIRAQTDWGTLAVLLLVGSVFSTAAEPVMSSLSRMQEHAADVYGQEAIHGIVADPRVAARGAFQVLGETSFDDPNPAPWLEWWTYSHPAIGRRAAFALHYDPWAPGMQPKYFPER